MSGQSIQTQHARNVAMHAPSTPFLLHVLPVFFPSSLSGHNFGRSPEPGRPAPASTPSTASELWWSRLTGVCLVENISDDYTKACTSPSRDCHLPFVASGPFGTAAGTDAGVRHLQNTRS
jgi:hypothetical protein